jgi:hypothetical protein
MVAAMESPGDLDAHERPIHGNAITQRATNAFDASWE